MKKRMICVLLALVLTMALLPVPAYAENYVAIDSSNFKDPGFREYVSMKFDDDGDNYLSPAEIKKVTEIEIHDGAINTLLGVEYFSELAILNCNACGLHSLDVSKNTKLRELSCAYNELTSLNVSKNTELRELSCGSNDLQTLNVSKNTKLTYLACDRNSITSLNVTKNTALTALICYDNALQKLDITKNKKLSSVACYGNRIARLYIGGSPYLVKAYREGERTPEDDPTDYWYDAYCIDVDASTKIVCVVAPKITLQPKSVKVKPNTKVTFKVRASGEQLKYQWYCQKPKSSKWTKVKNGAKAILTFKATKKLNGYKYRCKVYNVTDAVYSRTVTLKVKK